MVTLMPIPDRAQRRRLLTVYGRKAVLEALTDEGLRCRTLHLAHGNRGGGTLDEIQRRAAERKLDIRRHSRESLARISRNGRQDQGVALDVFCPALRDLEDALCDELPRRVRCIALDGVTNPQNMGMSLRSAAAAGVDAVLYAERGNPALGPLVIKASAGTVFRAPLLRCPRISDGARTLLAHGFQLYRLDARGPDSLFEIDIAPRALFVLGGETQGIGADLRALPGRDIHIPMDRRVESLNVAVSAALVAYACRGAGLCSKPDQRDR